MSGWSFALQARRDIVIGGSAWLSAVSSGLASRCAALRTAVPRRQLVVMVPIAAIALGSACQDPECEADRLELARTWETLRDTATSRQQIPEGANLTEAEQQERIRVWTTIEDRAELMRSSFETSQVTWPSAEKARADLAEAFKPLASNDDPMTRGFAVTLNEADQKMASFRKSCR